MEHAWIHQRMLMPAIVFVTRRGTESEPMGTVVSDSEAVFVNFPEGAFEASGVKRTQNVAE
jgi:hypothetical protein